MKWGRMNMLKNTDFREFWKWVDSHPRDSIIGYPESKTDSPLVRWLTSRYPGYKFRQIGYWIDWKSEGSDEGSVCLSEISWCRMFVKYSNDYVEAVFEEEARENDDVDPDVPIPLYREEALDMLEEIDKWGV
jgi:hypothetical protein